MRRLLCRSDASCSVCAESDRACPTNERKVGPTAQPRAPRPGSRQPCSFLTRPRPHPPQAAVGALVSLTRHDPCTDQAVKNGVFVVLNSILTTRGLVSVATIRAETCRLVAHCVLRSSDKNAVAAADAGILKTVGAMLDSASSDGQEGALTMLRELVPEPTVRARDCFSPRIPHPARPASLSRLLGWARLLSGRPLGKPARGLSPRRFSSASTYIKPAACHRTLSPPRRRRPSRRGSSTLSSAP